MSAMKIANTALKAAGFTVYPIVIPQSATLPCVVISIISEKAGSALETAAGYYEARVSLACHAATPAALDDLAEAVKLALSGVQQARIGVGDTFFASNFFKDTSDVSDYSDDRTVFRRVMDYRLQWWVVG